MSQDPIGKPGMMMDFTQVPTPRGGVFLPRDSSDIDALAVNAARAKITNLMGRRAGDTPSLWQYADGLNLYQFEVSRPTNELDPTGQEIDINECEDKCDKVAAAAKKKGVPAGIIATYLNNCYSCCGTQSPNDDCAGVIPIAPEHPVDPEPTPTHECHRK
jgi:hypothetical protein